MSAESRSPVRTLLRPAPKPRPMSFAASLGADLSSLSDGASPKGSAAPPAAPAAPAPAVAEPKASAQPVAQPAPVVVEDRQSLNSVLDELLSFDGSIGVALVDGQSGMVLGEAGTATSLGLSAAGASVILRTRLETNKVLGRAEEIADVLITLSSQIQIIHPLSTNSSLFLFLIGDKDKASLAMARYKAAEADKNIRL